MKLRAFHRALMLASTLLLGQAAAAATPPPPPPALIDQNTTMADEVAAKILATPQFQAKADGGRKVRIVIGDVVNNSDDERVRVEDIFSEIRNQIVAAGTTRLFAPGELNVDFIIAPELQSSRVPDQAGRVHRCMTLQLTLTTVSGEYVAAQKSQSCL